MEKRKLIIGTYDTATEGLWTLTSWVLGRAVAQENYVDIPGHSGALDLSTALTDGEPYYANREFEAILESSEGTRMEREERINQMVNKLDGWRLNIILPDDPLHYITGRIRIEKLYNDPVHASVRITATCDPWRYNIEETVVRLVAVSTEERTVSLTNKGRCSVIPRVTVIDGAISLKFNDGIQILTWVLTPGEYILGDIYIKSGSVLITYSGEGQIVFTYREAVL